MKRLLTLSLVFGFATAAYAQPATYPPYPEHEHQAYRRNWETLGEGLTTRQVRQDIYVPWSENRFSSVRLLAERGEPVIRRVEIEYGNGRVQTVDVNRPLVAGAGNAAKLNITLRGYGHVRRVSVISNPHSRGNFGVYAS
jgi:hypothetical protein